MTNKTILKFSPIGGLKMTKKINHHERLTKAQVVKRAAGEAIIGGALGGVCGLFGKWGLSFFNPAMTSVVGSVGTLVATGAIAAPLIFIPTIITDCLIENSEALKQSPHTKEFLKDTARLLLQIAGVAAAAAILSTPIGPTVVCMMVIPAIYYALKSICNVVNSMYESEPAAPELPGVTM